VKMLFIPGAGGSGEEWVYQTEYFTGSQAITLPGHPQGKPCSSLDDYVEWLRHYIHQHQYQDVVLIGHSMGSAIAQLYGLKYSQEIRALVLIGAGARLRVLPALLAKLERMITDRVAWRQYLQDEYSLIPPQVRPALLAARMEIGPAVTLNDYLCCDKFDIMEQVQAIKLPALIICGSEDKKTPVKYTRYLADNIDRAQPLVIDGATHWVHIENPREVNQAIEEFLNHLT